MGKQEQAERSMAPLELASVDVVSGNGGKLWAIQVTVGVGDTALGGVMDLKAATGFGAALIAAAGTCRERMRVHEEQKAKVFRGEE